MKTADFNELSESGEMVDMRQVDDVFFHETDHEPRSDIQYGGSVRIDE